MRSLLLLLNFVLVASAIKNPIISGWNPDAAILRVKDTYYLATSSFEYYPGTPIYKSKDLANWELFTHVQTTPGHVQLYGTATTGGVWAPSLSQHNGVFYLASMTRWTYDPIAKVWPRVYYHTSRDMKHWSEPIWCEPWGIDPSLFHDPISKKTYLNLMAPNNNIERLWGMYQCQIDVATGQCIGPYISLWNGTLPQTSSSRAEGPKMFYKDKFYYLLIAEGGTDLLHRSTIARSTSPQGPWTPAPNNPLLYNGGVDATLTIQSTGHATFVDTPSGKWYAAFLARRNINGTSPLGREAYLTTVEWKDGWPTLNGGKPILPSDSFGSVPDQQAVPDPFVDDFSKPNLGLSWFQLRVPYTQNFKLRSRRPKDHGGGAVKSGITFLPNVFGLSDRDTPAAILRKQKSLNMTFSAELIPTDRPLNIRQFVGASIYLSELQHEDIGVTGCVNATGMCIYTSLTFNATTTRKEFPLGKATIPEGLSLHIRAQPLTYSLGYSLGKGAVKWIQEFPSSWMTLAPPNWLVFTGASFAIFASGSGEPWPYDSAEVGFYKVQEEFYEENIPDHDVWE